MKLVDIIKNIDIKEVAGDLDVEICDIIYDSRKVVKNSLFVCLVGADCNGHDYIDDAVSRGAVAIVTQENVDIPGIVNIKVRNTRSFLSAACASFFEYPSTKIKTIAITGTKGKTSTSFMIQNILKAAGYKVGLIGTVGAIYDNKTVSLPNTTPESYDIHKYLNEMVKCGCEYVVLEASSIGLKTHRVDNILFDIGVFTNFSNDHIGGKEHADINEYLSCKSLLFQKCKLGIINVDDEMSNKVIKNHSCIVKSFAIDKNADYMASYIRLENGKDKFGVKCNINGDIKMNNLFISIPGKFNVYNALAAIGVCHSLGVDNQSIINGLKNVSIKGRLELLEISSHYTLIIDYAHNAVSMRSVLQTLKEYNPKRLVTLFGAGGNRPKSRRYEMGKASGQLSDFTIITSDNPRFENPLDIIKDIEQGIKETNGKYIIIPDRKEAIAYVVNNAQSGDIILLAGKGHETYQEIKGIKHPMDERLIVRELTVQKK